MTKRRQAVQARQDQPFKGRQFTAEVILWAARWYLMFPISYRDLELMLLDRGAEVGHSRVGARIDQRLCFPLWVRIIGSGRRPACRDLSSG